VGAFRGCRSGSDQEHFSDVGDPSGDGGGHAGDFADLPAAGSIEGCISLEIHAEGSVELIYAPYRYEGPKEGRYLGFELS
jgi:hypothetical protein